MCVKLNKNMSESKKLACPFCGGQARVICRGYQDGGKWTDWVSVTCPADEGGCGASQAATTEEAAWKLWNTRAGGRQPEPSNEASDKHIALQGLVRLLDSATRLNEIVEGVRNERWAANGQRLKDTPEWCDFYCKLKATAQQPNASS